MTLQLPIDEIEEDVRAAVGRSRPLIVTAPTGSGKSTRLPVWLEDEAERGVLVIEPRRVACRALAEFVAKNRGEKVGGAVGYTVRFDDRSGDDTRIRFVTPGIALNMLGGEDAFGYDYVVLDEFHERGWQVDLAAMILRQEMEERLVFTSATLEVTPLAKRLEATVLEAGGRTYPVDVEHLTDVQLPTSKALADRVARGVKKALEETDGDVLVFLPGKREISESEQAVRSKCSGVRTVQVHGGLPARELSKALEPRGNGPRRVFLATNVAETSLTLPDVRAVVDSGLVRMQIHRGGRTALALVPVSQASMDQRAGRAGRVAPGICYRLWDERWKPSAVTPPEVERIELDDAVLAAARAGIPVDQLDDAPWVTPPPEFAVEHAIEHLRQAGIVDDDHELTDYGGRLGELPVSVYEARILHDPPDELRATVADVVAIMQARGSLLLSTSSDKAKQSRRELLESCRSEVDEALVVLRRGDVRRHALHGSGLREARKAARRFRALLGCDVTDPRGDDSDLPSSDDLARHILSRVPEAAYVLRDRARGRRAFGRGEPWSNGDVELRVYPWEPHDPDRRDRKKLPDAGAILEQFWIGDDKGYGVNGVGRMLLPCSRNVLVDLELGDVDIADVHVHSGRVMATVHRELAGVVIEERERELRGRELCKAAAPLILEGRLMKKTEAAEQIADAFHLWRILAGWRETDATAHWDLTEVQATPVPEPAEWLAERLAELGLDRTDELALLEADDVTPDLVELSGLPSWDLDSLREDFPRTWENQGGVYRCEVRPSARTVLLLPANKAAGRLQEPGRRVVPRFRGFKVVYKKASREVVIR
jgi:ATP-dependent helicase HrpB